MIDFRTRDEQPKPVLNYTQSAIDLRPKPNWIKPCGSRTHFDVQQGYVDERPLERKHLLAKQTAFMREPKPFRGLDFNKLRRTEACYGFRPIGLLKWPLPNDPLNSKKIFPFKRSEMQLKKEKPYREFDKLNINGPLYYKKRFDENSRPNTANDTFVEQEMNRKIRVHSSYALRNGIPESSAGDKAYRKPECSNAFFKEPNLIVGSTNAQKPRNYRKNDVVSFDAKENTNWHKRPTRIYSNFIKTQKKKDEKAEVFNDQDKWESTVLKEFRPDYRDPDDDDWFFDKSEPKKEEDPKAKKAPPPKKGAKK